MIKKNKFKQLRELLKEGLSSSDIQRYQTKPARVKTQNNEAFDFLALIQAWPEVIGPKLSKNTIPLKNTRNSLTILTNHSGYSQELKFMEVHLIAKIKKRFPSLQNSLKTLYFKTDSTFFQKQKALADERAGGNKQYQEKIEKAFHKYSPEYRELKALAEEEFKDVESEEVRERLTSIFIQSRQKD